MGGRLRNHRLAQVKEICESTCPRIFKWARIDE